jgi:hypothetical protein
MVASTYVRGMAFERNINGLRAMEGRIEISPENIKETLDLSMGFEVVFRGLGYRVLSKAAMEGSNVRSTSPRSSRIRK